ncbi:MAG: T9SS type A sorting domain-containing protein [Bacteroidales bacterium]|nr:T9SS type A sorting domain-containing protein [Bacteroidales bacterium]
MKIFAPPYGILILILLVLSCMFSIPAIAQSIQIDSTFTTDAEIYPFENIELISELLIEGDVELNSDTSLVRVILEDENGFRYMVLEAYPLICPEIDFTVQGHCDETCALDMVNPQSSKSFGVMNALENRYEPMPDYMMAQIMKGQRILGAKELLEAQIQSWQRIRSNAKADLFRQFLKDINFVNQTDSIMAFLEEENDLSSKYKLAVMFWNRSDTAQASETLNTIPVQFDLTNEQLTSHQQYLDYFDILKRMADSNWTEGDLDSVSVQTLLEIENIGVSGISAFTRGMLVKGGFLNYIETITMPYLNSQEEFHIANKKDDNSENQENHLKLFPNPAGDYVIVFYDAGSDTPSISLRLMDNQGIVIRTIQLEPDKDQIVVNLENLPNGIYLFTLNVNGKKLESQKLIKIRN